MIWLRAQVHRFALWLLTWTDEPIAEQEPEAQDPEIIAAVFKGYRCYGLPAESFEPDFDLAETGKLYCVLGYALAELGAVRERRTIAEVVDYIRKVS